VLSLPLLLLLLLPPLGLGQNTLSVGAQTREARRGDSVPARGGVRPGPRKPRNAVSRRGGVWSWIDRRGRHGRRRERCGEWQQAFSVRGYGECYQGGFSGAVCLGIGLNSEGVL
jgi:hypothetical protein